MKKIRLVTSFNSEGYEKYGRKMIESAVRHIPEDCEFHVYYEGQNPCLIEDDRIKFFNLLDIPGVEQWLLVTAGLPILNGSIRGQYNYRYDAHMFTKKVFAQCNSATDFDGLMFWIDADVEFTGDLTESFLRECAADTFISVLRRNGIYLESSFVAWDCSHGQSAMFWNRLWGLMMSGEFVILPEWHDGYVLEMLVDGLELDNKALLNIDDLPKGPVNAFNILFDGIAVHDKGPGKMKKGPQRYSQLTEIGQDFEISTFMEIGTNTGIRAYEMSKALNNPRFHYIGFDMFGSGSEEHDAKEQNTKRRYSIGAVSAFLAGNGISHSLYEGDTNETLPKWIENNRDPKPDMIFIDGGHSIGTIRSDFENALKILDGKGVIVFDDYYEGLPGDGMEKWGCNKVLEESGYSYFVLPIKDPVVGGGTTQLAVMTFSETGDKK